MNGKSGVSRGSRANSPLSAGTKTLKDRKNELERLWVPPDVKKAKIRSLQKRFRKGAAEFWKTPLKDLEEMGSGVYLYFYFHHELGKLFGLASLLVIPLFLCYWELSSAGTSMFSTAAYLPKAVPPNHKLLILGVHISSTMLSVLATMINLLIVIIFVWKVGGMMSFVRSHKRMREKKAITSAAYSILVRGLPGDTSRDELMRFFSRRYDLTKPIRHDEGCLTLFFPFLKKSRVVYASHDKGEDGEGVVKDCSNTGTITYSSTWLAELELLRPRARSLQACNQVVEHARKLRILKHMRHKALTAEHSVDHLDQKAEEYRRKLRDSLRTRVQEGLYDLENQTFGAFVTFNHVKSRIRCLQDFKKSNSWFGRLFQPDHLKFRSKFPLRICPAPEPSEVLWENLEFGFWNRVKGGIKEVFLVLSLLFASFALSVIVTSANKSILQTSNPLFCSSELPSTVFGTFEDNNPLISFDRDSHLLKFDGFDRETVYKSRDHWLLDSQKEQYDCLSNVDLDDDTAGSLPECLSLSCLFSDDKAEANSEKLWLYLENLSLIQLKAEHSNIGGTCTTYDPVDAMRDCYCVQETPSFVLALFMPLYHAIHPPPSMESALKTGDRLEEAICYDTWNEVTLTGILTTAMSLVVVVVNVFLKGLLVKTGKLSRPISASALTVTTMVKILLTQFINTALIGLIQNLDIPSLGFEVLGLKFFKGSYSGLTAGWLHASGVALVRSMEMQTFIPHFVPLTILSWKLMTEAYKARRAVCDIELETIFKLLPLGLAPRYATLVAFVAVAFSFSAGLPLLFVIMFFMILVRYWFDKWLLLRFCQRPPDLDHQAAELMMNILRWLPILHVVFTVSFFSESEVFPQPDLSDVGIVTFNESIENALFKKITRHNCWPLCLFVTLVCLFRLMSWILGNTPFLHYIRAFANWITAGNFLVLHKAHTGYERLLKLKNQRSGFTDVYSEELAEETLTKRLPIDARLQGWRLVEHDKSSHKVNIWMEDGLINGVPHYAGALKRTWEVVQEGTLYTYNILKNQSYSRILEIENEKGLEELMGDKIQWDPAWLDPFSNVQLNEEVSGSGIMSDFSMKYSGEPISECDSSSVGSLRSHNNSDINEPLSSINSTYVASNKGSPSLRPHKSSLAMLHHHQIESATGSVFPSSKLGSARIESGKPRAHFRLPPLQIPPLSLGGGANLSASSASSAHENDLASTKINSLPAGAYDAFGSQINLEMEQSMKSRSPRDVLSVRKKVLGSLYYEPESSKPVNQDNKRYDCNNDGFDLDHEIFKRQLSLAFFKNETTAEETLEAITHNQQNALSAASTPSTASSIHQQQRRLIQEQQDNVHMTKFGVGTPLSIIGNEVNNKFSMAGSELTSYDASQSVTPKDNNNSKVPRLNFTVVSQTNPLSPLSPPSASSSIRQPRLSSPNPFRANMLGSEEIDSFRRSSLDNNNTGRMNSGGRLKSAQSPKKATLTPELVAQRRMSSLGFPLTALQDWLVELAEKRRWGVARVDKHASSLNPRAGDDAFEELKNEFIGGQGTKGRTITQSQFEKRRKGKQLIRELSQQNAIASGNNGGVYKLGGNSNNNNNGNRSQAAPFKPLARPQSYAVHDPMTGSGGLTSMFKRVDGSNRLSTAPNKSSKPQTFALNEQFLSKANAGNNRPNGHRKVRSRRSSAKDNKSKRKASY